MMRVAVSIKLRFSTLDTELTNVYRIRRGAIDHNIPLITNARLASAFIEAFCELKLSDMQRSLSDSTA